MSSSVSVASGDGSTGASLNIEVPSSPSNTSQAAAPSPVKVENPFDNVDPGPPVPSLTTRSTHSTTSNNEPSLVPPPQPSPDRNQQLPLTSSNIATVTSPSNNSNTSSVSGRVMHPTNITNIQTAGTNTSLSTTPPRSPVMTQQQRLVHPVYTAEDDEDTAPSSAANTAQRSGAAHSVEEENNNPNTIVRFIENTRKRLSSHNRKDSDIDDDDDVHGVLISGYLQKLGRNGKWQTRWFETDGECLSYYKNAKRTKLMATLDLQKVGLIEIDMNDTSGCAFLIQVLGRLYHLRAESRVVCKDWVIMLNRVKEARLQQGNVKLVGTGPSLGNNLLDNNQGTPRVVVVANRQRTRAVDEEEQWDKLIRVDNQLDPEDPTDPDYISQKRHSALSNAVVARWSKRHSSLQRLGAKLSKWARSLKKYSCADMEQEKIYLDRHVHPPGHDDKAKREAKRLEKAWIEKETTNAAMAVPTPEEPVETPPSPMKIRSHSTASDYDARMIS